MRLCTTYQRKARHPLRQAAFTLTELVVVGGLVALLFTTGATAYRTLTMNQSRSIDYQKVTLGQAITNQFYPPEASAPALGATLDVWAAPHYGSMGAVNVMREKLNDDIAKSIAIFPLPRGAVTPAASSGPTSIPPNVNWIHPPRDLSDPTKPKPGYIALPTGATANPAHSMDTAAASATEMGLSGESFYTLLRRHYTSTSPNPFPFVHKTTAADLGFAVGTDIDGFYRGVPRPIMHNASLFFIQAGTESTKLYFRSVWDIDLIDMTSPKGVFASVRRYEGAALTHFYHVFFEGDQTAADFGPVFASFEKRSRLIRNENTANSYGVIPNAFKKAEERPFFLLWWPDPSMKRLSGLPIDDTLPASDPRYYYSKHERQSGLMFVVPCFPQL
jgi:hypothetical protein